MYLLKWQKAWYRPTSGTPWITQSPPCWEQENYLGFMLTSLHPISDQSPEKSDIHRPSEPWFSGFHSLPGSTLPQTIGQTHQPSAIVRWPLSNYYLVGFICWKWQTDRKENHGVRNEGHVGKYGWKARETLKKPARLTWYERMKRGNSEAWWATPWNWPLPSEGLLFWPISKALLPSTWGFLIPSLSLSLHKDIHLYTVVCQTPVPLRPTSQSRLTLIINSIVLSDTQKLSEVHLGVCSWGCLQRVS